MDTFTYRSARMPAVTVAIGAVIVIETTILHIVLRVRHPAIAWTLTTLSVTTLIWLLADARAFARGALRLDARVLDVQIGRRWKGEIPRRAVIRAFRPAWRDLPAPGTSETAAYANVTKPAEPNVLLVLREPVPLLLMGGVTRRVTHVGLHVDSPDALVEALAPVVNDSETIANEDRG